METTASRHALLHSSDRRIDYAKRPRGGTGQPRRLGAVVHLSRDAFKLLLLAHGISRLHRPGKPVSENFPTLTLLYRQLSRPGAPSEADCTLTLSNTWGQFEFRAERLEPVGGGNPALIGVTIQHRVPREVHDLDVLEANPRSIAQKRVCAQLLRGLSQPQIAARLGVSHHTVIDHIRKIYLKLDVHSAEEYGRGSAIAPTTDAPISWRPRPARGPLVCRRHAGALVAVCTDIHCGDQTRAEDPRRTVCRVRHTRGPA